MTSATTAQLRMSMLDYDNYFIKRASEKEITNEQDVFKQEKVDEFFAKDGDFKYDKAMDYDGDGIVTYDEYMRYCEENAVSESFKNPSHISVQAVVDSVAQNQSIRPLNIGKALSAYIFAENVPHESAIESQA